MTEGSNNGKVRLHKCSEYNQLEMLFVFSNCPSLEKVNVLFVLVLSRSSMTGEELRKTCNFNTGIIINLIMIII